MVNSQPSYKKDKSLNLKNGLTNMKPKGRSGLGETVKMLYP